MAELKIAVNSVHPASNRLLAALKPVDLELLKPLLTVVALPRGRVLFEPGDEIEITYLPCDTAMVSLAVVLSDGREIEAATIGREGAIGGIVSAGQKPAFGRAAVQIPGAAYSVPTVKLEELKQRSSSFGDLFARYADVLLAQLMQSVACNALHSVEQRFCRWLLATGDRIGEGSIPLTQESLSEMLGVQRTTVTAVASDLQARGLISYHRGRIDIIDHAGLKRASCECYGAVEAHFHRLLPEVDRQGA